MAKTLTSEQQEINRLQKQIDEIKNRQRAKNSKALKDPGNNQLVHELGFDLDMDGLNGEMVWSKLLDKEGRLNDYVTYDIENNEWVFSRLDDWTGANTIEMSFDNYDDLFKYIISLSIPVKKKYVFTYEFDAYEFDDPGDVASNEINELYTLDEFIKEVS